MASLIDRIVDKRTEFILGLKREALKILSGNIETDYVNLIGKPLEDAKTNPYFLEMHDKLDGKPFTWESLKVIPEITGITEIRNGTLGAEFQRATAAVDNHFRQFLEPAASLPFFYGRKEKGIEPNCVGAAQILATLYSFRSNPDDLEMLLIHSSKRRQNVLSALKDLNEPQTAYREFDFVEANVDSFSGMFSRRDLQNLLLDHVLTLEDSGHIAIRKKNGEVFDHKLEADNFKVYEVCSIKDGIWATGISHLVQLYTSLGIDPSNQWRKIKPKISELAPKMAKIGDYSLGIGTIEDLRDIYGSDLPVRYLLVNALENPHMMQEVLETISKNYAHPDSKRLVVERYFGQDGNNLILGGKK